MKPVIRYPWSPPTTNHEAQKIPSFGFRIKSCVRPPYVETKTFYPIIIFTRLGLVPSIVFNGHKQQNDVRIKKKKIALRKCTIDFNCLPSVRVRTHKAFSLGTQNGLRIRAPWYAHSANEQRKSISGIENTFSSKNY